MHRAKNILILGDSWSQGELEIDDQGKRYVVHGGVHQYLTEHGYNVVNLGGIGDSNSQAYMRYARQHSKFDLILWFQTDVLRDVNHNYKELFYKKILELKSIRRVFDSILIDTYKILDNYAEQKNEKIFVLGGFSTVPEQILDFTNLINFIPSIISLIDPNESFPTYSFFTRFEWFTNLIENMTVEYSLDRETINYLKEEYICMVDENIKTIEYMQQNKKYFWPDGLHPNRHAHQIIFNKIKEELLND